MTMENNNQQQPQKDDEQLAKAASSLSFNAGAASFVPNFSAPAFVPGGFSGPASVFSLTPDAQVPPVHPHTTQPIQPVQAAEAPAPTKPAVTASLPKKAVVMSVGGGASKSAPSKESSVSSSTTSLNEGKSAPTPSKSMPATKSASKASLEASAAPEMSAEEKAAEEEFFSSHKSHLNIVFIGHVDAGKSTMGGHILYLTGMVDKRTLEKFEREAKEMNRESWYLSWALDTDDKERAKGKTVDVGRAYFETDKRRFTILDAPGHKNYVPNMISGASQADVGVLVISARKGEFETGFEKGGQTREHAILAKTAGVKRLIVVVNKMDDPTVKWDQGRYDEIIGKLSPFLKQCGWNPKTETDFMPVSGFSGANLKDPVTKDVCSWYSGPSLLQLLDSIEGIDRKNDGPFLMPVNEKYKDLGTIVAGKIESGRVRKGKQLLMMPTRKPCEVLAIFSEQDDELDGAQCGDNVRLKVKNIEEEDISPGFVLSDPREPIKAVTAFEAQLMIMDHKNIICPGYNAVLHIHNLAAEVTIGALLHLIDKKTNRRSKKPPMFVKKGQVATARLEANQYLCLETYADYPQLGRFTLRDEGKTIAMGKVTKLILDE